MSKPAVKPKPSSNRKPPRKKFVPKITSVERSGGIAIVGFNPPKK